MKYSLKEIIAKAQEMGFDAVQVTEPDGSVLAEIMGTEIRPAYLFPDARLFNESHRVWGFIAWQTLPCDITAQVMGRLKIC